MEKQVITVDQNLRELCEHGSPAFPMTVSHDDLSLFLDQYIRCHWHGDLEIVFVQEGQVSYQIHENQLLLSPGDILLINSDVPHSAQPVKNSHVILLTTIIQPIFLYDALGSDIEKECFRPFLKNQHLPYVLLNSEEAWIEQIRSDLHLVDDYFSRRPYGFQLKIKSLILGIFFEILTHKQDDLGSYLPANQENLRRLQLLLDYLHGHYQEPIPLQSLAENVHLTRETVCRFFKQMTGKTVTQYLTDYRIRQSLQLLSEGRYSIAQVAEQNGFSSPSRFASAFRRRMGCNPKEYIHQNPFL